jgi:shikimate dehydrogenase
MPETPKIFALFGDPVKDSLFPVTLNAAFLAAGYSWPYVPFRANEDTLADLFERLKRDDLAGANFASPCEEAAVALCDQLSAEAELLAAVDTVRFHARKVEGLNTAVNGFARSLDELALSLADERVLILGANAPARACGVALEQAGASVTFAAQDLARPRPGVSTRATVIRIADADVFLAEKKPAALVNAAPPEEAIDTPLIDYGAIPSGCFVYDLACGRRTPLLEAAEARGLRYADGTATFIYRSARAFEIWTGVEAPLDAMRRAATAELQKREL